MGASAPETVAFAIRGPIAREDLPGLCERVCALLGRGRPTVALCDVRDVEADAVTVDALARLQLAARRYAARVILRGASAELAGLVELLGLDDVLVAEGRPTPRAAAAGRRAGRAARCRGRT